MTLALDTSALLARELEHPARRVVDEAMAADTEWCTSALALTEAMAVVDRLAIDPADATAMRHSIRSTVLSCYVVPLDERCLERAGELARDHPLRITDAIHLAAADRLPGPVRFLTLDPNQMPVAEALGFEVASL
jgi:uncharacterized protein